MRFPFPHLLSHSVKRIDIDYVYDLAGRLTLLQRYDSLDTSAPVAFTRYAYYNDNTLQEQADVFGTLASPGASIDSYAYTYDLAGMISSETDTGGTSNAITYDYDDSYQLTATSNSNLTSNDEDFSYDPAGNRTGNTLLANNRLIDDGTYSYTYDKEGDLLSKTDKTTGDVWTYTYDNRHRLTQVHADGPTVGHTYTPIGYDEKGNVYNVNGPNFFDGTTPVSGYHSTGVSNGDFVLYFANPNTGQLLSYDPDNWSLNPLGTRWMLTDAQGSTRAVITGSTVADRITYSSFGTITSETASPGLDQPTFTYEGMVDPRQGWNAASGLLLDHARLYDPNTARFLTPDPSPATNNDALNLYRYAWNDPVNLFDPTGTSALRGPANYNTSSSNYASRSGGSDNFAYFNTLLNQQPAIGLSYSDPLAGINPYGFIDAEHAQVHNDYLSMSVQNDIYNNNQILGTQSALASAGQQISAYAAAQSQVYSNHPIPAADLRYSYNDVQLNDSWATNFATSYDYPEVYGAASNVSGSTGVQLATQTAGVLSGLALAPAIGPAAALWSVSGGLAGQAFGAGIGGSISYAQGNGFGSGAVTGGFYGSMVGSTVASLPSAQMALTRAGSATGNFISSAYGEAKGILSNLDYSIGLPSPFMSAAVPMQFNNATQILPKAYSVAFEMQLAPEQLGLRQAQHFQIANQVLEAERANNSALAQIVSEPAGWGRPPTGWTWQHATIEQAGGRAGVLQLVPRAQHTPGSPFWSLLHPLPGNAGGYSQWAVPAGAPPR